MATATFNGASIGDAGNGILSIQPGHIERAVQVDEVLGLDGVVTRHRGGGRQSIVVEAWKKCASTVERLAYIEDMFAAFGRDKAPLVYTGNGGTHTWPDCLAARVREDHSLGAYVRFTLTFVRSAF